VFWEVFRPGLFRPWSFILHPDTLTIVLKQEYFKRGGFDQVVCSWDFCPKGLVQAIRENLSGGFVLGSFDWMVCVRGFTGGDFVLVAACPKGV